MEENIKTFTKWFVDNQSRIAELEEENQTLKDNVEFLHSCLDDRDKSIELMKEKIRFLEQCLDNKEKVNISLREENKKLKEENKKVEI